MNSKLGKRRLITFVAHCLLGGQRGLTSQSRRSMSVYFRIAGYWILMAISSPVLRYPWCTCANDAHPTGVSSIDANNSSAFTPRSSSITQEMEEKGTGVALSYESRDTREST